MPQLIKGEKYIFGWTSINKDLRIRIPNEIYNEYKLIKTNKGNYYIKESIASGGFSIITPNSIINSKLCYNIVINKQRH